MVHPPYSHNLMPSNIVFHLFCFADDVLVRMMDDRSAETSRTLHGHNGPVYRVAFSPDRMLLLSCSEDTTGIPFSCYRIYCFYFVQLLFKELYDKNTTVINMKVSRCGVGIHCALKLFRNMLFALFTSRILYIHSTFCTHHHKTSVQNISGDVSLLRSAVLRG